MSPVGAEISIANLAGKVASLLSFAEGVEDADAVVVLRRALFETGRLPAVDLQESWSRLVATDPDNLAHRAKKEVARGNAALTSYLSQPFFVSEPWTSVPGETTEREEMVDQVLRLIGRG